MHCMHIDYRKSFNFSEFFRKMLPNMQSALFFFFKFFLFFNDFCFKVLGGRVYSETAYNMVSLINE